MKQANMMLGVISLLTAGFFMGVIFRSCVPENTPVSVTVTNQDKVPIVQNN